MKTQFVLLSILLFSAFMVFSNTNVYADSHSVSVAGGGGSEGVSTPLSITLDGFTSETLPDSAYSITNDDGTAAPDWITVDSGHVLVNPPFDVVPVGDHLQVFNFTLTATEGDNTVDDTFTFQLVNTADYVNFVTNPAFFETRHEVVRGTESSINVNPHISSGYGYVNSMSNPLFANDAGVLSFDIPANTPLGDHQVELLFCDSANADPTCADLITFKFKIVPALSTGLFCGELATYYDTTIVGTVDADYLVGTRGDDLILGGDGNDFIRGGAGNDCILGGDGHDFIQGGGGSDTIYGGIGDDVIRTGGGNDTVYGEAGNDIINGPHNNGSKTFDGGDGHDMCIMTHGGSVTTTSCEITGSEQ